MKILYINTFDKIGGAGIAAFRLMKGLLNEKQNIQMMVYRKISNHENVVELRVNKFRKIINKIIFFAEKKIVNLIYKQIGFSLNLFQKKFVKPSLIDKFDIVHLHWLSSNFISIDELSKINKPIIWTLHDMWAFTGGCFYVGNCNNYISSCGNCISLNSRNKSDISSYLLNKKHRAFKKMNITFVCPSNWIANCLRKSKIVADSKIFVIANGINTDVFKPLDKKESKKQLNLSVNKLHILFVAQGGTNNHRKGFDLLISSLQYLKTKADNISFDIITIGAKLIQQTTVEGFNIINLGEIKDDNQLAAIYSAADVFVAPSREDNLPNTIMESMACGTPAIAFDIGGISDLINNNFNGLLINSFDCNLFAIGINRLLLDDKLRMELSINARETILKNFEVQNQSKKYIDLYKNILK